MAVSPVGKARAPPPGRNLAHERADGDLQVASERLDWKPRRINVAAQWLVHNEIVDEPLIAGNPPYAYVWLTVTPTTRRFIKQR